MQIDEGRLRKMHVRHVILQTQTEVALPVGQIVQGTQCSKVACYALCRVHIDAAIDPFIRRHFKADDEIGSAAAADLCGDLLYETHASFQ
jgi:hypothetical protein